MKNLSINLSEKSYDIIIRNGIIDFIGEEIKKIYPQGKIMIVTDKNVDYYYGNKVIKSIESSGFNAKKIVMEPGEETKSLENVNVLYNEFLDFNLSRTDLVVALGGGVIGDLTGFASATYLRGIPFVQVPTSLLAQIDSSIGGKVGVDLKRGKNLAGAFYQPKKVIIDPDVLSTLSDKYLYDGMGEVIKYGCIKDKDLFIKLENINGKKQLISSIEDIIYTCCNIKKAVVEKDEKDTGERMILNFGHTIGHAIEKYFNFSKFSHGEAVAIGMYYITKISEKDGISNPGTAQRIKSLLTKYNLPCEAEVNDMENIINTIMLDKKGSGDTISLIMIREIGDVIIHKVNKKDLKHIISI
ncbi:MAG: 3-dehydroquinate synthase [Bacillota bacterium]|nr:3-dehydroquinate synthase [Bacillota bacterium]